jgi:membrane-associated phospholipid phosphatase
MKKEESTLARIVSEVFEPTVIFLAITLIGAWHVHLRGIAYGAFALYLVGVGVLITVARVRLMRIMHTNWDISNRSKRVRLLAMLLAFCFALYWSTYVWHNPSLTNFFALFVLWLIGFFLITLRLKISGHMGVLVLAIGMLSSWYEISLWVLASLIPILGWSRVKLKRHTMVEVICGTAYSLGIVYLYNKLSPLH